MILFYSLEIFLKLKATRFSKIEVGDPAPENPRAFISSAVVAIYVP
jgi:hypothetical protein